MSDVSDESRGRGRPTDYKDEYVEVARRLCVIGLTDQQIADYFETSRWTLKRWQIAHPDFCSAMVRSRDEETRMIRNSLSLVASGYSRMEKKDFVLSLGGNQGSYIKTKKRIKHFEPNVTAALRWMEVYDPIWSAAKGDEEVDVGKLNESIEKLIGAPRRSTDDDAEKVDDQRDKGTKK